MNRILVVDDDIELCELLTQYLEGDGFEVAAVQDGEAGLEAALSGEHDLVVLDVMLPGLNGLEVLRRLRHRSEVPVLMLTARGEEVDRIVGLEVGADDYLPKPFNTRELVARIRAIQRRLSRTSEAGFGSEGGPRAISVGDIELDLGARIARRDGEEVRLTGVEFDLLATFLRGAGTVLSREMLTRDVLGREHTSFDRAIDMHVSNLRKKLGHTVGDTERIQSIRGAGYIYARPAAESAS